MNEIDFLNYVSPIDIQCRNCGAEFTEPIRICEVCGKDINEIPTKETIKAYNELWEEMERNMW